jgi:hypothetical protein
LTAPGQPYGGDMHSLPWWGGHQRRRRIIPRKPDRLGSLGRQSWGAWVYSQFQGVYPEWDPQGRRPTEATVAAGLDQRLPLERWNLITV